MFLGTKRLGSTKKKAYKYNLVEVIWDDAESDYGWEELPEDELKPKLVTTVAFLIKESEHHILLASSYDDHMTNNRMQIPRGMIKDFKVLK